MVRSDVTLVRFPQHILAAVGGGLYVYSVLSKAVVAYRKCAHDSNVLHTMLASDR